MSDDGAWFGLVALAALVAAISSCHIGFRWGRTAERSDIALTACVERCKPAGAVFVDDRCGCEAPPKEGTR